MTRESEPKGFHRARRQAEEIARDPDKTKRLLEAAWTKAKRHQGFFDRFREDFKQLLRMLKAWREGAYTQLPWQSLLMALAAIVYFVNPLDIIPDFIVGAGLLDDATVLAFVLRSIQNDLSQFGRWESQKSTSEKKPD